MSTILRGNIRFYPGWNFDVRKSINAPALLLIQQNQNNNLTLDHKAKALINDTSHNGKPMETKGIKSRTNPATDSKKFLTNEM